MDFTLTVNPQELRAISDALGELKYSVAKPLIDKLNGQLAAQAGQAPATAPPPESPPPAPQGDPKPENQWREDDDPKDPWAPSPDIYDEVPF